MPMLNNKFRYAAVQKITGEIHIETVSLIPARILTHVVKMPNAKQTVILQKINLIQTSLIDAIFTAIQHSVNLIFRQPSNLPLSQRMVWGTSCWRKMF